MSEFDKNKMLPAGNKSYPLWIILGVVAVAALGAVFFAYQVAAPTKDYTASGEINQAAVQQVASDDISQIDNDLKATDVDGLGKEMSDIQKEVAP